MGKCERRKRVTITSKDYDIYTCEDCHVHIDVRTPELTGNLVLADSLEASTFAEGIMRCFDEIEGIQPSRK